ncbi:hypothetical protein LTR37_020859 [Vermiconidia calcicola]|uniref:Uncharacterized protein n=1 Tax=Vermiconidia calcicola TaxID=1690605 RepID=A0ACC3MBI8_9PEZI|nr:hypothetical protein LTR37_020859 [Vermiconidia calcicola]
MAGDGVSSHVEDTSMPPTPNHIGSETFKPDEKAGITPCKLEAAVTHQTNNEELDNAVDVDISFRSRMARGFLYCSHAQLIAATVILSFFRFAPCAALDWLEELGKETYGTCFIEGQMMILVITALPLFLEGSSGDHWASRKCLQGLEYGWLVALVLVGTIIPVNMLWLRLFGKCKRLDRPLSLIGM